MYLQMIWNCIVLRPCLIQAPTLGENANQQHVRLLLGRHILTPRKMLLFKWCLLKPPSSSSRALRRGRPFKRFWWCVTSHTMEKKLDQQQLDNALRCCDWVTTIDRLLPLFGGLRNKVFSSFGLSSVTFKDSFQRLLLFWWRKQRHLFKHMD